MLLAQGLGAPSVAFIFSLLAFFVALVTIFLYFLISWLGLAKNATKRIWICGALACWIVYHTGFPNYVSSDSLTSIATAGTPSSRLIELIGPPHDISEDSKTEMMWFYYTGYLADGIIGVTINRGDGTVVDWYVQ